MQNDLGMDTKDRTLYLPERQCTPSLYTLYTSVVQIWTSLLLLKYWTDSKSMQCRLGYVSVILVCGDFLHLHYTRRINEYRLFIYLWLFLSNEFWSQIPKLSSITLQLVSRGGASTSTATVAYASHVSSNYNEYKKIEIIGWNSILLAGNQQLISSIKNAIQNIRKDDKLRRL